MYILFEILFYYFCISVISSFLTVPLLMELLEGESFNVFINILKNETLNINIVGKVILLLLYLPIIIIGYPISVVMYLVKFIFTWHPGNKKEN